MLIVLPCVLGFANGGIEMWAPVIFGAVAIFYSLITNYEVGIFKIISFKTHLAIDVVHAILLGASPWIFGFANRIFLLYLFFGLLEILVIFLTKMDTYQRSADVKNKSFYN